MGRTREGVDTTGSTSAEGEADDFGVGPANSHEEPAVIIVESSLHRGCTFRVDAGVHRLKDLLPITSFRLALDGAIGCAVPLLRFSSIDEEEGSGCHDRRFWEIAVFRLAAVFSAFSKAASLLGGCIDAELRNAIVPSRLSGELLDEGSVKRTPFGARDKLREAACEYEGQAWYTHASWELTPLL